MIYRGLRKPHIQKNGVYWIVSYQGAAQPIMFFSDLKPCWDWLVDLLEGPK